MIRQDQIQNEVLKMLGDRELHGYDIHKQLEERGLKLRIGRLYEILNQMSRKDLLKDTWQPSPSGPQKRVYRISAKGRKQRENILMDAIQTVHEFYGDYLRNLPPEKGAFSIISRTLLEGLRNEPVIAFVSMTYSKSINYLLRALQDTSPRSTIYFVGPRDVFSEMDLDSAPYLEGSSDNIPSKDGYFDLLVLPGIAKLDSLTKCIKEWQRVIHGTGKVGIVTPTALIRKIEDPMSIGEFIEQKEHPSSFVGSISPEQQIITEFQSKFLKVDTKLVVHVSVIQGVGR